MADSMAGSMADSSVAESNVLYMDQHNWPSTPPIPPIPPIPPAPPITADPPSVKGAPHPLDIAIIGWAHIAQCFQLRSQLFHRRHAKELKALGVVFPLGIPVRQGTGIAITWCAFPRELQRWAMWRAREGRYI